jgi:hypothetical protein
VAETSDVALWWIATSERDEKSLRAARHSSVEV